MHASFSRVYTAAINDPAPNTTAPTSGAATFRCGGSFKLWVEHDNDLGALTSLDATVWVRDETPTLSDPTRPWRRLATFTAAGGNALTRNVLAECVWTPNAYTPLRESHEFFIQLTNPVGTMPTTTDTLRLHVMPLI